MFMHVGALRAPSCPLTPTLNLTVSENANSGLWHEAQLMVLSEESILSKNNFSPSSALVSGVLAVLNADQPTINNANKENEANFFILFKK